MNENLKMSDGSEGSHTRRKVNRSLKQIRLAGGNMPKNKVGKGNKKKVFERDVILERVARKASQRKAHLSQVRKVLSLSCCLRNHPKPSSLNQQAFMSPSSIGSGIQEGSVGWSRLRLSREVTVRVLAGAVSQSEGLNGAAGATCKMSHSHG